MSTAERLDIPTLNISTHAIIRRLEAEAATEEERQLVLSRFRRVAERVIREELARARLLSDATRQIFMHPRRFAFRGMRHVSQRHYRDEPEPKPRPHVRHDGDYCLVGDWVCYVVDNGGIVTTIIPNPAQIEAIAQVEGPIEAIGQPVNIMQEVREEQRHPRTSAPRRFPSSPQRLPPPPESAPTPISLAKRSDLNMPRWLKKPNARWTILVVDPREEDVVAISRRISVWLRKEFEGSAPEQLWVERTESTGNLLKNLPASRRMRIVDLPSPPSVSWSCAADMLPRAYIRWWNEAFGQSSPAHRTFLAIVTPSLARSVTRIVSGVSAVASSGQTIRLVGNETANGTEWSTFVETY